MPTTPTGTCVCMLVVGSRKSMYFGECVFGFGKSQMGKCMRDAWALRRWNPARSILHHRQRGSHGGEGPLLPISLRSCSGQRGSWDWIWSVIKMRKVLKEFGWHQLKKKKTSSWDLASLRRFREARMFWNRERVWSHRRGHWKEVRWRQETGELLDRLKALGENAFLLYLVNHHSEPCLEFQTSNWYKARNSELQERVTDVAEEVPRGYMEERELALNGWQPMLRVGRNAWRKTGICV